MRKFAASILFVPALLSAQAVHSGVSRLVARMDAPAFAFQAGALHAAPSLNPALTAPIRLTKLQIGETMAAANTTVDVAFTVDANGVPQDVHVVKNISKPVDDQVVEAVRQVRYTPGTLHGKPVAMPVLLHVSINR